MMNTIYIYYVIRLEQKNECVYSQLSSNLQSNPNLSLACLLLSNPERKAGNMSSWWGPTWISVRCGGKSEWTSSPVGLAQTRAQMKPPASTWPTPPCQVKTAQSEAQRGRQEASMPSKANSVSLLPSFDWFFCWIVQNPPPVISSYPIFLPAGKGPLASTAPSEADDQLLFQGPASLCFASFHLGGSRDEPDSSFVAMQL